MVWKHLACAYYIFESYILWFLENHILTDLIFWAWVLKQIKYIRWKLFLWIPIWISLSEFFLWKHSVIRVVWNCENCIFFIYTYLYTLCHFWNQSKGTAMSYLHISVKSTNKSYILKTIKIAIISYYTSKKLLP